MTDLPACSTQPASPHTIVYTVSKNKIYRVDTLSTNNVQQTTSKQWCLRWDRPTQPTRREQMKWWRTLHRWVSCYVELKTYQTLSMIKPNMIHSRKILQFSTYSLEDLLQQERQDNINVIGFSKGWNHNI